MPVEACAQLARPLGRANPPMNEPQVTPAAFSRSPIFWPDMVIWVRLGLEQMSPDGSGSPITAPVVAALAMFPLADRLLVMVPANVVPATRLRSPGVEGPKEVPKELSLIAKCCA